MKVLINFFLVKYKFVYEQQFLFLMLNFVEIVKEYRVHIVQNHRNWAVISHSHMIQVNINIRICEHISIEIFFSCFIFKQKVPPIIIRMFAFNNITDAESKKMLAELCLKKWWNFLLKQINQTILIKKFFW